MPEMSVARWGCAAVCIEGNVYVVGGKGSDGSALKSVEVYDGPSGQWRALPETIVARCGWGCFLRRTLQTRLGWTLS